MGNREIVVPRGMLVASVQTFNKASERRGYKYVVDSLVCTEMLEAALQWLAENPIEPDEDFCRDVLSVSRVNLENWFWVQDVMKDFQKQMFLAPEEDDQEAKDAAIRREARKRALDEVIAWATGTDIDGGVGSDIARVTAHVSAMKSRDDDSPISDLLEPPKPPFPEGKYRCYDDADVARRVREAYRRGKEGK